MLPVTSLHVFTTLKLQAGLSSRRPVLVPACAPRVLSFDQVREPLVFNRELPHPPRSPISNGSPTSELPDFRAPNAEVRVWVFNVSILLPLLIQLI